MSQHPTEHSQNSRFKSRGGLRRIWRAGLHSRAGFAHAWRHEAAFRQEFAIGAPLAVAAWWLTDSRAEALALSGVILLVWIVELLNSAIEALADAVCTEHHPLIGRAKDIGSAAVMLAIGIALLTWVAILLPLPG
ncbi:MAG: hypothetical protein RIS35_97 [Pseudomonadota bacterium]|jgi:diacylglycerol kinase (ATP)